MQLVDTENISINVWIYDVEELELILIHISYKLVSVSHCVSFNSRSNYEWGKCQLRTLQSSEQTIIIIKTFSTNTETVTIQVQAKSKTSPSLKLEVTLEYKNQKPNSACTTSLIATPAPNNNSANKVNPVNSIQDCDKIESKSSSSSLSLCEVLEVRTTWSWRIIEE